jgi:hypothetical protein
MKKWTRILFIGFYFHVSTLFAAQDTTVIKESAAILSEAKEDSEVIEYLALGTEVRVSDYPVEGRFYKIRARNGTYGWIEQSNISVYKPDPEKLEVGKDEIKPEKDRLWAIRGFGGYSFTGPSDLNDLFGFKELSGMYHFGSEVSYRFLDNVAAVARVETLFKDVTTKEINSGQFYGLALRSYPVLLGLDYYFLQIPTFRFSVGIFGGLAFKTSFSSKATGYSEPNMVLLESNPFVSELRLNATRPLGRLFSIFMEGGYRLLRSDKLVTSSAGGVNGGPQIFVRNSVYVSREIDLSGPFISLGIGIHL